MSSLFANAILVTKAKYLLVLCWVVCLVKVMYHLWQDPSNTSIRMVGVAISSLPADY